MAKLRQRRGRRNRRRVLKRRPVGAIAARRCQRPRCARGAGSGGSFGRRCTRDCAVGARGAAARDGSHPRRAAKGDVELRRRGGQAGEMKGDCGVFRRRRPLSSPLCLLERLRGLLLAHNLLLANKRVDRQVHAARCCCAARARRHQQVARRAAPARTRRCSPYRCIRTYVLTWCARGVGPSNLVENPLAY